jgi:hypothetical protein
VYSRVAAARTRGTYSIPEDIQKIVIDICDDDDNDSSDSKDAGVQLRRVAKSRDDSTISPITMHDTLSAGETTTTTSSTAYAPSIKKSRKSARQASVSRFENKKVKTEDDDLYKAAFKIATRLVAAKTSSTS